MAALAAKAAELISRVCPSGAALATASVPMVVPAPARFSTTPRPAHGPLLHDHGVTPPFAHLGRELARQNVSRTARRQRDDHAHWPRRVGLRPRNARYRRQCGNTHCEAEKLPTVGKFHNSLPEQL